MLTEIFQYIEKSTEIHMVFVLLCFLVDCLKDVELTYGYIVFVLLLHCDVLLK